MCADQSGPRSLRHLVSHHEIRRIARFLVTGGIAFGLDFGGLVLFHSGLDWDLRAAVLVAYPVGGVAHYLLTKFWVFPSHTQRSETGRIARYLLLGVANFALTLFGMLAMVRLGLDYRVAKVLCVGTLVVLNYVVSAKLIMH